jgi:hypothetical protein
MGWLTTVLNKRLWEFDHERQVWAFMDAKGNISVTVEVFTERLARGDFSSYATLLERYEAMRGTKTLSEGAPPSEATRKQSHPTLKATDAISEAIVLAGGKIPSSDKLGHKLRHDVIRANLRLDTHIRRMLELPELKSPPLRRMREVIASPRIGQGWPGLGSGRSEGKE